MTDGPSRDAALGRLEEVLSSYPYDSALPPLDTILSDAGVDRGLLDDDDRAVKLLHEAIVARPLSTLQAVKETRTEVELLTLEVSVLVERFRDPDATEEDLERAEARLRDIRAVLDEVREEL